MRTECPQCGASMEVGFLLDQAHGSRHPSNWIEGDPEKSVWTGTKIKGKRRYRVETYRCKKCGFLRSYAREQA